MALYNSLPLRSSHLIEQGHWRSNLFRP